MTVIYYPLRTVSLSFRIKFGNSGIEETKGSFPEVGHVPGVEYV